MGYHDKWNRSLSIALEINSWRKFKIRLRIKLSINFKLWDKHLKTLVINSAPRHVKTMLDASNLKWAVSSPLEFILCEFHFHGPKTQLFNYGREDCRLCFFQYWTFWPSKPRPGPSWSDTRVSTVDYFLDGT